MDITLYCPGCGKVQGVIENANPQKTYQTDIYYCPPCSLTLSRPSFNREEFNRFMSKRPTNHIEALAMAKRLEERRFD